ncbi:PucR family transcriptional regulator, partial [Patulibacter sp. S7RM1-6]
VGDPLQVGIVRPRRAGEGAPEARAQARARVRAELEVGLTGAQVPFVLTERGEDLVLVAPAGLDGVLEAPLHELASAGGPLDGGVGRATTAVEELPRSYQDARFALQQLATSPRPDSRSHVLAHADLDLVTTLVCDADSDLFAPRRDAVIAALGGPPLEETLRVYLERNLDVTRTAQALHLHPNSLRYRLTRIEERLGRSLRDPATIALLHVAFRYGWAFREA